jgi:hypothetical protein
MIRRALASCATWLFNWIWAKEKRNVALSLNIGGKPIPLADLEKMASLVPSVFSMIADGKHPEQIVAAIEPALLPIIESVANIVFPGSGTAIEVIAFLIANSKTMTQEETNAWMDRAGRTGSDQA